MRRADYYGSGHAKLLGMEHILYYFQVRDQISGKWRKTRYRLSDADALDRYGEGNYERLDWSREVRTGGGMVHSAPLAPK